MITPSIGRIVHFVLPKGEHVPALIVGIASKTLSEDALVNLQVFHDRKKDPVEHVAKVKQAVANKKPGTWHEPERV